MYLNALIPRLVAQGHQLWFAYETEPFSGTAVVCERSPRTRQISTPSSLRQLIREIDVDIAFAHGLDSAELEEIAVNESRVAHFLHGYQGTCISGAKRHAFPSVRVCHRALGPACLAYYLPTRCGGLNPVTAAKLYSQQRRRQKALQRAAAVIVGSVYMRDEAIKNGVDPPKVFVAPLFPTTQIPDIRPPHERRQSGEILFVGRVTKVKGLEVLVRALPVAEARLGKRLRLVVAGDGVEIERVRLKAQEQGVDLDWRRWVNPDEREALMRRADLLALPSLWPEPFGIVGLEAAAVGLPAVAFATGGISEWLMPGVSGEASAGVPSVHGLADAIVRALREPAHHQRLRVGAWESARKHSVEQHLAILGTAFASIAGTDTV